MEFLPYIYLTYMFISIYMLSLFLIIYLRNIKSFFDYPKTKKIYTVSFVVPAYNEGESIEDSIKNIMNIDYQGIVEVIIVNDCSTDNTKEIVESLLDKYSKLKLINNKKNTGSAAGSQNIGLKKAKGELIAVVDADSFPSRDSIKKMVGYFDDLKVGAVTCPILARNKNKFFEKLQAIEYQAISFGRKLLEYVDAIYVTPGPLALYRKKALEEIGGFDEKNLTQDIEATWHLAYNRWKRKMCLATSVTSVVPSRLGEWWVQRRRWNVGGLQCISKYRKSLGKKGMLGLFIIPFFIINLFLGLFGLSIFFYVLIRNIISRLFFTTYTIKAGTPLLTFEEFYITPSFLNYLGIILFLTGLIYVLVILSILKVELWKKENILNIPFYLTIYLILYPFIMVNSIWHFYKGKSVWR
ncbi:glycosyltransferase [Candidatus Pacearchaeota archaeon]|nr:glycosyltransferase [Candidatus Pacearchaeota archaeon]MBD3283136.1 glycosyltransferase [Candidatus Pacearchaeota archaeon]